MALPTRARIAGILAISLLTLSAPGAQAGFVGPDAQIRLGSGSYVGGGTTNNNAFLQTVFNSGVVDQKLTFFIKIVNHFGFPENFKVKRSGLFNNGYRVRYYDAANNDITGQVNAGTFTTPPLVGGGVGTYEMRATVKVRPQATPCSFVTRLMTVTSITSPNNMDAVRFTAALATPAQNCAPVAVNDTASIFENQTSVSGNLFANDIDPDGDPLFLGPFNDLPPSYYLNYSIGASTGAYTWSLDNTGPVDALNNGQTLTQVIQYAVSDGSLTSNTATLTITIHGVTDPD